MAVDKMGKGLLSCFNFFLFFTDKGVRSGFQSTVVWKSFSFYFFSHPRGNLLCLCETLKDCFIPFGYVHRLYSFQGFI